MATTLDDFTASALERATSIDAARWVSTLYLNDGDPYTAAKHFAQRYPRSLSLPIIQKAASAAGTTTDADWAAALSIPRTFAEALVGLARPQTIIGRAGLRQAPLNVAVPAVTAGASFSWAGQGKPKPVGEMALTTITLGIAKASGILVVSQELVRSTSPAGERALRDELVAGLAQFLDEQFLDPAIAAVTNVSPGSILNGVTPIPSSGTALDDVTRLIATFVASSPDTTSLAFLLSPGNAAVIAATGAAPNLRVDGTGTLFGIRALTSTAMGSNIALIDPTRILLGDEGGLDLSISRQASIQMDTAPDDPPTASTVVISLFQRNLVGVRVERIVNWQRAADSAVQYVANAVYIGGSPA